MWSKRRLVGWLAGWFSPQEQADTGQAQAAAGREGEGNVLTLRGSKRKRAHGIHIDFILYSLRYIRSFTICAVSKTTSQPSVRHPSGK